MPKRLIGVLVATVVLFVGLSGRLYSLSVSSLKAASWQQSTRTQTLYTARGTVYDRYLVPLVNDTVAWAVSLYPYGDRQNTDALMLTADQREAVRQAMEDGHRATFLSDHALLAQDSVVQTEVPVRYTETASAVHLIGYVNGEGQGVCGIEAGYQQELAAWNGELSVSYAIDALGRPSSETVEQTVNTLSRAKGGVVLSIDSHIQTIVRDMLMSSVDAGAVIVSDADSGQVLAMASAPEYNPNEPEASLEAPNAPMLDRTLALYNVGSVFKTLVAAAALEQGYGVDTVYECREGIAVNGIEFACRDHGRMQLTMLEAMALSCNAYFIQLAMDIGADAIVRMATLARWDAALSVAKGIQTQTPIFPTPAELTADAALANTAIGQGRILASAFHVQSFMRAVACDGMWVEPTLYHGRVDADGRVTESEHEPQTVRLFSKDTAAALRSMLSAVVSSGTGQQASPTNATAFGKTGTAESGWEVDGAEVVQSWFSGGFPVDRPQYVITVLSENGGQNGKTAAPMFAAICNALFEAGLVEIS